MIDTKQITDAALSSVEQSLSAELISLTALFGTLAVQRSDLSTEMLSVSRRIDSLRVDIAAINAARV